MEYNFSAVYRLANKDDVLNLAVLLWEHIEELSQVDIVLKDEYISTC